MPKRKTPAYARIAITLPAEDLAAADRAARERDRSRSWVIAEAVRLYTTTSSATSRPAHVAGLGPSRLAQLTRDLGLTPEERVREAEATARAVPRYQRGRIQRVISFERFEDYLDWKAREAARACASRPRPSTT
jgi:Ribbon-helix-helix protein, copG family